MYQSKCNNLLKCYVITAVENSHDQNGQSLRLASRLASISAVNGWVGSTPYAR